MPTDMPSSEPTPMEAMAEIPLLRAAELQDHLMTATNDLERLQQILLDASDQLLTGFHGAVEHLGLALDTEALAKEARLQDAMRELRTAVMALQFQDMASQLINHTHKRLRNCADQLARDTLGDDDPDGATVVESGPLRPNPVTQDEMDEGSVELF